MAWARAAACEVAALWLAGRDSRTPRRAKLLAAAVAAYALSPIDLIPDFIPVLGYLDDLVLVPLGAVAAVALIPPDLMDEFRSRAAELGARSASRLAAAVIVAMWITAGAAALWSFGVRPG